MACRCGETSKFLIKFLIFSTFPRWDWFSLCTPSTSGDAFDGKYADWGLSVRIDLYFLKTFQSSLFVCRVGDVGHPPVFFVSGVINMNKKN